MTKIMRVSAAVAFAAAVVVFYFLFFSGTGSPDAEYLKQAHAVISAIKAADPSTLGFAVKSNPLNGGASQAVASANVAGSLSFGAEATVSEASESVADAVTLLISSMGDPTVTVSETLTPGTPPASIYFYLGGLTNSYNMKLSGGEVTYIIQDDKSIAVCRIPVDSEASLNLLAAVGMATYQNGQ